MLSASPVSFREMITSLGCLPINFIIGCPERLLPALTIKGSFVLPEWTGCFAKARAGIAISEADKNCFRFMLHGFAHKPTFPHTPGSGKNKTFLNFRITQYTLGCMVVYGEEFGGRITCKRFIVFC